MNHHEWHDGVHRASWWRLLLCAVLGHAIADGHPRVQDCLRCGRYRYRLGRTPRGSV